MMITELTFTMFLHVAADYAAVACDVDITDVVSGIGIAISFVYSESEKRVS
jgi:hypothetical protein